MRTVEVHPTRIAASRRRTRLRSLEEGDRLVFRVEGDHAILARTSDLLALAGSISVPVAKRGRPWAEVLAETRRIRAATRR